MCFCQTQRTGQSWLIPWSSSTIRNLSLILPHVKTYVQKKHIWKDPARNSPSYVFHQTLNILPFQLEFQAWKQCLGSVVCIQKTWLCKFLYFLVCTEITETLKSKSEGRRRGRILMAKYCRTQISKGARLQTMLIQEISGNHYIKHRIKGDKGWQCVIEICVWYAMPVLIQKSWELKPLLDHRLNQPTCIAEWYVQLVWTLTLKFHQVTLHENISSVHSYIDHYVSWTYILINEITYCHLRCTHLPERKPYQET